MDEEVLIAAEQDAELPLASYPSEGIEDSRVWSPDDEVVKEVSSEAVPQETSQPDDIESIRQRAIEEYKAEQEEQYRKFQEEAQRKIDAEAEEAWLSEEEDLVTRANNGDLEAQERLYQRALDDASAKVNKRKTQVALEPERSAARNEIRRQLWEEYSNSFGVAPDDKEILELPAEAGMRGINAALIRRTSDEGILNAARQNPAIQKWIKEEVEKASKAAGARAMARALGSDESPKADAAVSVGGKAITSDELDRALMQNPDDSELYKLWVKRERAAGRYW